MPTSLKNNERDSGLNSVGFKKAELSPVRVFSIILDDSHPKYAGEDSIGTIFYGKVDLNESSPNLNSLSKAKPLFSFIKYFPLVNEIVLILNATSRNIYSDTKGDNVFVSNYYLPNINVWNNPQQNALPLERDLKNKPNANNAEEASLGIEQNQSEKNKISLGEYFTEKDNIKSLQPFEGDLILEGRFGNSIRMGATTPSDKPNNWSSTNNIGDPITIISNGQVKTTGDTVLENINETPSSIFLLSNQNINNFIPASTNIQSIGAPFTPPSTTQVLIVDTPEPPTVISPDPIIIEPPEPIFEETITIPTPPTEAQVTSSAVIDDPIFALLDEAQDEGTLKFTQNIYTFSEYSTNNNFDAAALPDELNEELYGDDPIINGLDYINQLPLNITPQKVRYTPVFIKPKRNWTQIPQTHLAQIINSSNISNALKHSVMFVALKEQSIDKSHIGGFNHNHYGIMSDIGKWSFGSKIIGSVAATEGVGGQGVRTDKIRYFAAFASTKSGVNFMADTLKGKGFDEANENNIIDLYLDKWLSPSPATAQSIKQKSRDKYRNIFNNAKNLIDAV